MMIALGYELPMIRHDTSCLNCARCLSLYLFATTCIVPSRFATVSSGP